jgi:hypothetical protein
MSRENLAKLLARGGILLGALLLCISCNPRMTPPPMELTVHKHGHAKCTGTGSLVEIEIAATTEVLVDPEDEATVVCHNDILRWFTNDDQVASFTIDFNNKDNPSGLFGPVAFPSEKGASGSPHYPHQHTKDQKVVVPPSTDHHIKDYLYSIDVCCDPQNPGKHFLIDPHVIPMGK